MEYDTLLGINVRSDLYSLYYLFLWIFYFYDRISICIKIEKKNNAIISNKIITMIYEENPLHVELVQTLVPVACEVQDEIRINVAGEPVIDPKRDSVQTNESNQNIKKKCENALDLAYFVFLILLLMGFFGAFILFLVWMSKPDVFGENSNNY